jgi:hypothetical protein
MGGRRGCSNSFEEGTLVLMADGTYKPIEDIEPGDMVLATSPLTGTTGPQPVLATIESHGDKALVEITIHDQPNQVTIVGPIVVIPHGQLGFTTTVVATDNHPFWNPTTTAWTNADNLQPGDHLLASDGTKSTVTSLLHHTLPDTTVYNLTITTTHTYYVIAGNTPVLVHNAGPGCGGSKFVWPRQQGGNCLECATRIKGEIGGDIVHITPRGAPRLGASTHDPNGMWSEHYAVVKGGLVYDGTTGPSGLTPSQYKAQWGENAPYINFGF